MTHNKPPQKRHPAVDEIEAARFRIGELEAALAISQSNNQAAAAFLDAVREQHRTAVKAAALAKSQLKAMSTEIEHWEHATVGPLTDAGQYLPVDAPYQPAVAARIRVLATERDAARLDAVEARRQMRSVMHNELDAEHAATRVAEARLRDLLVAVEAITDRVQGEDDGFFDALRGAAARARGTE